MRIKVLDSRKLKKHPLWADCTKLTLSVNMRALESEKQFSKWLLDASIAKEGDVVNLPEICYPEAQDPIAQLYNDIDFRNITSKQLKDRAILTVTNDISLKVIFFCLAQFYIKLANSEEIKRELR
ncbi:hypothetical protein JTE90_013701 [Oedothorax gibbosus]|uniref:ATP-dependent DNA helicase n=1 Tax=Oedothorax gibbosus TaxID=931172 RepID=A0AAV6UIU6_9ARAC|nr:hypothetical protein JTE90_013701 [Oedothorax gibbosus]